MPITLEAATVEDAAVIASLRTAVARDLTARYGKGHWSFAASERGVLFDLKRSRVFVARRGGRPVATLCLSTRKPWFYRKCGFREVGRAAYRKVPLVYLEMLL
jgi:hypothetical protein